MSSQDFYYDGADWELVSLSDIKGVLTIKLKPKEKTQSKQKRLNNAEVAQFLRMADAGKSIREIADTLGISYGAVHQRMKHRWATSRKLVEGEG